MNIALITYHFFSLKGGVSHTLESLYKCFKHKDHNLYIFNPYQRGKNIFRFPLRNTKKLNIFKILKNRWIYYFFLLSVWKLFKDKKIDLSNRLKMILYLFLIPFHTLRNFYNLIFIYPYLKKLNIDIIFGMGTGPSLTLTYHLSKLLNKKVVSLSHGNDFLIQAPISFKSLYIRYLDKIILSNNKMLKLIKRIHNLDENQLVAINRGIILKDYNIKESKSELRNEFNIPKDQFVLLSVGRQVERKKFFLVIKAVDKIIKNNPSIDIKYYLIGTGPFSSKLKELTKKLKLVKYIEFLGSCETDIRNKFYKLSDVFLMPSISKANSIEGFGISFLEANYYKIPVIGAISGGIIEAIIDGKTGLLVKPNDLNDLVEKIIFLYENKELRNKMGEIGNNRIIKEFDWNKIVDDYINTFKRVLEFN